MEKKETMKTITKLYWLRTEKKDLQKRIQEIDDTLGEMTQLGSPAMSDMPKSNTRSNPTEKYVEKLISLKKKKKQADNSKHRHRRKNRRHYHKSR